jgi:hypothetical protein
MSKDEVADALVALARRYSGGTESPLKLLRESGYYGMPDKITESVIQEALTRRPELVRDWQIFSENKRSTGWYWRAGEQGGYEVRCDSEAGRDIEVLLYRNEVSACAAFIKRNFESMRVRDVHSRS